MQVPLLDKHLELSQALYRQRNLLINHQWSDGILLASVEHRLRSHLFVLSHYIDEEEDEPSKEHEVFVYLARRILAFDQNTKIAGWNKALDWLTEPGEKENGARSALILLPPYGEHLPILESAFNDVEPLRPMIINIWQKTNTKVSKELIQRSDLRALQNNFKSPPLTMLPGLKTIRLIFWKAVIWRSSMDAVKCTTIY